MNKNLAMAVARAIALLVSGVTSGASMAQAPVKLSDWLLAHPSAAETYALGLSWRVPSEMPPQKALQSDLMASLTAIQDRRAVDPVVVSRMQVWLMQLPVTGRVPVALADVRWLQANPARDPIIQPDHIVVLPARPRTVTVVTPQASLCEVAYEAGRSIKRYVDGCQPKGAGEVDWAWVVQPDGRVQRFGIALWNAEKQDNPAPGAWIWAPSRRSGWPEDFSVKLAQFLATQGPAFSGKAQEPRYTQPKTGNANESILLRTDRELQLTAGDWGGIGVLQTPSARMNRTGAFGFTLSRVAPYRRANIFLQPFDWLEAGFRYTFIGNRPYDPSFTISTSDTYVDKSFDAKVRLWEESAYVPEVAVGSRDLTGTGLFSGEYIVGNKRTGPLDWSLGLGWGYTGGRGDIRNPLRFLGRADTRTPPTTTGEFSFGNFFAGPAAWFGGVQYQTPWEPLILKLEYDGNNYQNEPQANNQVQKSPWNFGAVYRLGSAADLSLAWERGNMLSVGLTLRTDLPGLAVPKISDPPRTAVAAARPSQRPDWVRTVRDLRTQTSWDVSNIEEQGSDLRISLSDASATYWRDRIDRAAAVLHRDAPTNVGRFVLSHRGRGMEIVEHVIHRDTWVRQQLQPLPPRERGEPVMERAPTRSERESTKVFSQPKPAFEHGLGFHYQQTLGGPDGFVLFQAGVMERATLRLREDTWLQGSLQLGLVDNYEKFKYTAPSNLPRVRTFLREYVTASDLTMPNLQATHVGRAGQNHFYSIYGGYLEPMFAGVGVEWLWRPFGSRVALGVDINSVQQREFEQDFALRDYKVKTGHATLYWDTGWNNVQANVAVGQYLAGDRGATLNISRGFENGVRIGAFATRTNVSSEQFGEGSFDKGVYISIPFDAFLTRTSGSFGTFVWKPLTRDGGAMLGRAVSLYNITGPRDPRTLEIRPAPLPNESVIPADRREKWVPEAQTPPAYTQVQPKPMADQWEAEARRYEQRLSEALYGQQFRNLQVSLDTSRRLNLQLSSEQIRPLSRAAGRAARTALQLGPLDLREIKVTLLQNAGPAAVYEFVDLQKLEAHFEGRLTARELAPYVKVSYPNPNARQRDPLEALADLATGSKDKSLVDIARPPVRVIARVASDVHAATQEARQVDWLRAGVIGASIVGTSALLDRRAYTFANDRADNRWLKAGVRAGDALPLIGLGLSALAALDTSDPIRSRTGYAALEAGGAAYVAASGLKYVVGRERPGGPNGHKSFNAFSNASGNDAFPSRHAMVAWAVATPFAEEYNAPWLYGLAAITNLARIGSREHWVSDTVAGSLLGYGLGRLFHAAARRPDDGGPRLVLSPGGAGLVWSLK